IRDVQLGDAVDPPREVARIVRGKAENALRIRVEFCGTAPLPCIQLQDLVAIRPEPRGILREDGRFVVERDGAPLHEPPIEPRWLLWHPFFSFEKAHAPKISGRSSVVAAQRRRDAVKIGKESALVDADKIE